MMRDNFTEPATFPLVCKMKTEAPFNSFRGKNNGRVHSTIPHG